MLLYYSYSLYNAYTHPAILWLIKNAFTQSTQVYQIPFIPKGRQISVYLLNGTGTRTSLYAIIITASSVALLVYFSPYVCKTISVFLLYFQLTELT